VPEQLPRIEASLIVAAYAATHPNVEVWSDDEIEDGWAFFSVLAMNRPERSMVADIRMKSGRIER
jgi:hypothetical protein